MDTIMLMILAIGVNLVSFILLLITLKQIKKNNANSDTLQNTMKTFGEMISDNLREKQEDFNKNISEILKAYESKQEKIGEIHLEQLKLNEKIASEKRDLLKETLSQNLKQFEERLKTFSIETEQKLENIRKVMSENLQEIREDNNKKLDEMRTVVDHKLSETLNKRMTESC